MGVGQRVVRRRRGCKPDRGTVVEVVRRDEETRVTWFRVRWDHGVTCLMASDQMVPLKRG